MPTFPTYRGNLPTQLNPLNPRHYFLLAYWVLFRPTAFHCYLYRAAPDLYSLGGWQKIRRSWQVRAYRSLYLMAPISLLLLAALMGLMFLTLTLYNLQGHTSGITAVAAASNGQLAISASSDRRMKYSLPSSDGTLKVWDLERGAESRTLKGQGKSLSTVAISSDGKFAVSGGFDRSVGVWDLQQGRQLHQLRGHERWIADVAISPDGKRAVSASGDRTLKVWDLDTGQELRTLAGHAEGVNAVVLTSDGKRAVSASSDGTLKVWDLETGRELRTLAGHAASVNTLILTPDDRQAISASSDRTLKVWDLETGRELRTLSGHANAVARIALAPGRRIISGAKDNTLKVWDLETGRELHTLSGHTGWISAVAVEGRQIISASSDNTLKVWDLETGQELRTLAGHTGQIQAMAALPGGKAISVGYDRFPKVWEIGTGREQPLQQVQMQRQGLQVLLIGGIVPVVCVGILGATILLAIGFALFGLFGGLIVSVGLSLWIGVVYSMTVVTLDRLMAHPAFREFDIAQFLDRSLYIAVAIVFGVLLNAALNLANRRSLAAFGGILITGAIAVSSGLIVASVVKRPAQSLRGSLIAGYRTAVKVGIFFNLYIAAGTLRLLFYPFQFLLALGSLRSGKGHPVEWDELIVLPLPGTARAIARRLKQSPTSGLTLAAEVAANPFQRSAVGRSLHRHLHQSANPLHFLYTLLAHSPLNSYCLAPVAAKDWSHFPSRRSLLLAELGLQQLTGGGLTLSQKVDAGVRWLTGWGKRGKATPLVRFAGLLSQLLDPQRVAHPEFDLADFKDIYTALDLYPGGTEIALSFAAFAQFLHYRQASDIAQAVDLLGLTDYATLFDSEEGAVRPSAIAALRQLREIASHVASSEAAPNQDLQLSALARALGGLERLQEFLESEVADPERQILQVIVERWRKCAIAAMDRQSTRHNE